MKKYLDSIYKDTKEEFYNLVLSSLKKKKKMNIITVNPEIIMLSETDNTVSNILLNTDYYKVPDGISVVKKIKAKERITGIDLCSYLLEVADKNKYTIYLFGASNEVINTLVSKINTNYPNINIVGFSNGYVKDKDKIMKEIIKLSPDICLIAQGVPIQEKLIDKYYSKMKKGIFVGVGGSFDVLSDTKRRAPKIFIKTNTEWLYRIITEPNRIKRFVKYNIRFMFK